MDVAPGAGIWRTGRPLRRAGGCHPAWGKSWSCDGSRGVRMDVRKREEEWPFSAWCGRWGGGRNWGTGAWPVWLGEARWPVTLKDKLEERASLGKKIISLGLEAFRIAGQLSLIGDESLELKNEVGNRVTCWPRGKCPEQLWLLGDIFV